MAEETSVKLGTEGADPLLLGGVNDVNLQELERALGVRVALRGDQLTVSGPAEQVDRAATVAQGLIDLARIGETVTTDIVSRLAVDGGAPIELAPGQGEHRILLPGLRRPITPKTAGQRDYLQAIAQHDLSVGIGPAGTGKTYLAVAMAVDALNENRVQRLILVRPAVEAGEKLGFLPGDLTQKVDPYLRPLYDALYEMLGIEKVTRLIERNVIEIAPLAYMRGRTLNDSFVILDEAQNTTVEQMKMFLTRIGFGSAAVVTGDVTQIDLPRHVKSGLRDAIEVLRDVDGISFTFFTARDVVRHPLVQRIVRAYESRESASTERESKEEKT